MTRYLVTRYLGRDTLGVSSNSARFVHALAKALDQPQHPRRPAAAASAAQSLHDPQFDGIDQCGGFRAQRYHEFIERFEPRHLQQLMARDVEDEGRDANAKEFRKDDGRDRAEPILVG